MGVVEQSRGVVESQLSTLEETYDSFSINQRTVTVPTAQYERKRKRSSYNTIEVHAKVANVDSDVLYVVAGETTTLPSTTASVDQDLETVVRETVSDTAGIDCLVEEIAGVTILDIRDRNDPDREPLYQLAVLFGARHQAGSIDEDAVWKPYEPDEHPVYV